MEYITETERIYALDDDGHVVAEVTFPTRDGVATIDHTYVHASLRGQGVAARLVELAVAKIEGDGHQVAATCSYAMLWLRRHR